MIKEIGAVRRLKEMAGDDPEWWTKLDDEQQKTYLEQHPNSKMAKQKRAEEDEGDQRVNMKPGEAKKKLYDASAPKNLEQRNWDGSKKDASKPSAPAKKAPSAAQKKRILALRDKFKSLKEKLAGVNPKSARAKAIKEKMKAIRNKVLEMKGGDAPQPATKPAKKAPAPRKEAPVNSPAPAAEGKDASDAVNEPAATPLKETPAFQKLPKPTQERVEKFVGHLQKTAAKSMTLKSGLDRASKDAATFAKSWEDIKADPDVRGRLENYCVSVGQNTRDESHLAAYTHGLMSAAEKETDPDKKAFMVKSAKLALVGRTYAEVVAAKQAGKDPMEVLNRYGITSDEWNARSSKNEDDPVYTKLMSKRGAAYSKDVTGHLNKAVAVAKATRALQKKGLLGDELDEDTVNSVYDMAKHVRGSLN